MRNSAPLLVRTWRGTWHRTGGYPPPKRPEPPYNVVALMLLNSKRGPEQLPQLEPTDKQNIRFAVKPSQNFNS
jgi:hypothetical protein